MTTTHTVIASLSRAQSDCDASPRDGGGRSILLIGLLCLFALQGCAVLAVSESSPAIHGQSLANLPMTIRTLDADQRFSQLPSTIVAQRLHALRSGEPLNI